MLFVQWVRDTVTPTMSGELITTAEAARLLSVSQTTIDRWIRLGHLRAVRLPSGRYRVPREEVDKLLREAKGE
jgi:putative resolvase